MNREQEYEQLCESGLLDEFAGPYPLLDTAPLLAAAGYYATSEQSFAEKTGITLPEGKAHSALFDARLTRSVWRRLTNQY